MVYDTVGAGVVEELLGNFPEVTNKVDENGFSALHKACLGGHADVARLLLSHHPQLALQFNEFGYLPVHFTAMNGKTAVFEQFLQLAPLSFLYRTRQGDPIIYLTIQYNQFHAFLYLLQTFHHAELFLSLDHLGNSLLHVAVLRGRLKVTHFLSLNPSYSSKIICRRLKC